jgi:hypothetical protein
VTKTSGSGTGCKESVTRERQTPSEPSFCARLTTRREPERKPKRSDAYAEADSCGVRTRSMRARTEEDSRRPTQEHAGFARVRFLREAPYPEQLSVATSD